MRKKYTSKTYMRGVSDWDLVVAKRKEYKLAKQVCSNLYEEIKEKRNIFVNMDKKELIQKYFK